MADKTYLFDTKRGAGVPGLPHIISDEWLKANPEMESVFKAALQNGAYKEKAASASTTQRAPLSAKSAAPKEKE